MDSWRLKLLEQELDKELDEEVEEEPEQGLDEEVARDLQGSLSLPGVLEDFSLASPRPRGEREDNQSFQLLLETDVTRQREAERLRRMRRLLLVILLAVLLLLIWTVSHYQFLTMTASHQFEMIVGCLGTVLMFIMLARLLYSWLGAQGGAKRKIWLTQS